MNKLLLKINILFIILYYDIKNLKHKFKNYFLQRKINRLAHWNFTKCKAIYKRTPRANYKFYVVDYYKFPYSWDNPLHILDMRNKNMVNTKYFHTKKEAKKFLNDLK